MVPWGDRAGPHHPEPIPPPQLEALGNRGSPSPGCWAPPWGWEPAKDRLGCKPVGGDQEQAR